MVSVLLACSHEIDFEPVNFGRADPELQYAIDVLEGGGIATPQVWACTGDACLAETITDSESIEDPIDWSREVVVVARAANVCLSPCENGEFWPGLVVGVRARRDASVVQIASDPPAHGEVGCQWCAQPFEVIRFSRADLVDGPMEAEFVP